MISPSYLHETYQNGSVVVGDVVVVVVVGVVVVIGVVLVVLVVLGIGVVVVVLNEVVDISLEVVAESVEGAVGGIGTFVPPVLIKGSIKHSSGGHGHLYWYW